MDISHTHTHTHKHTHTHTHIPLNSETPNKSRQINKQAISLLVMQCSAGKRRLRSNPCRTERMLGRWTNCSTKRWLWNRQSPMHLPHHSICHTHPQHCTCLNITVLYPTLHQYKHCNVHSSKRWRWSGWCYAPPCTHPSGREVCGTTCSLPARC